MQSLVPHTWGDYREESLGWPKVFVRKLEPGPHGSYEAKEPLDQHFGVSLHTCKFLVVFSTKSIYRKDISLMLIFLGFLYIYIIIVVTIRKIVV